MKIGDKVKFNDKYGFTDGKIHTVTSKTWKVNDDKELVLLDGKNGGWLVDGLEVVTDEIDD